MTIEESKNLKAALEDNITNLIEDFERKTKLTIEEITLTHEIYDSGKNILVDTSIKVVL